MNVKNKIDEDFRRAVKSPNTAEVHAQLDAGAEVNATDSDGFTASMLAARHGHLLIVRILFDVHADGNAQTNNG